MKPSGGDTNRWSGTFGAAACAITLCLICVATVRGQAPSAPHVPMAEEVFNNIQVLKGIRVDQFMGTMGIFAAALGKNCSECRRWSPAIHVIAFRHARSSRRV